MITARTVVVSRHTALIEYLREIGLIGADDVRVISHATPDQVRGAHVIGVLPLHLAALALSVTEIALDVPPDCRGRELTLEELRRFSRGARRYVVREEEMT